MSLQQYHGTTKNLPKKRPFSSPTVSCTDFSKLEELQVSLYPTISNQCPALPFQNSFYKLSMLGQQFVICFSNQKIEFKTIFFFNIRRCKKWYYEVFRSKRKLKQNKMIEWTRTNCWLFVVRHWPTLKK